MEAFRIKFYGIVTIDIDVVGVIQLLAQKKNVHNYDVGNNEKGDGG